MCYVFSSGLRRFAALMFSVAAQDNSNRDELCELSDFTLRMANQL